MLKFAGRAERGHTGEGRRWSRDTFGVGVPTVDQVDEFLAPMAADTVLQILHGQGIYWGPRVDKTYAETHRAGRGPYAPRTLRVYDAHHRIGNPTP